VCFKFIIQRERERERDRETETERQRDRETERQRDRETETEREIDKQRDTQRDRETDCANMGMTLKALLLQKEVFCIVQVSTGDCRFSLSWSHHMPRNQLFSQRGKFGVFHLVQPNIGSCSSR
jgi:serine/threonine protein phosphatase PrpC